MISLGFWGIGLLRGKWNRVASTMPSYGSRLHLLTLQCKACTLTVMPYSGGHYMAPAYTTV